MELKTKDSIKNKMKTFNRIKITNMMGIYNNKMRSTRKMDNYKNKPLNNKINNKLMNRNK